MPRKVAACLCLDVDDDAEEADFEKRHGQHHALDPLGNADADLLRIDNPLELRFTGSWPSEAISRTASFSGKPDLIERHMTSSALGNSSRNFSAGA